ncbi:MAG: amino acid ABC transporter substrate-binding protein [Ruminococcus sp.]|nr:amino acid ABC transporter substrate-binding protein [Ruminococcus sp.]
MKKTLALLLAVAMIITAVPFVFSGCGSSDKSGSKADTATTTLTVGFDAEFPPYGYKDEKTGEYKGFDLDLAAEVCKRNNWELKKQPIDWDSKDMELNSGTIDCIWNGFTINGREDDYTWSVPYIDNSQVVVVGKSSDIKSLADLKGKTVAVQSDSSALAALTGDDATKENKKLAASFKELQQIPNYETALLNLESGAVDAVCMDIGVANYKVEASKDKFRLLDDQISSEQYGIGFKKGNTELKDKVEKTLLEMSKDGTVEKIAKEYKLEDALCLGK